MSKVELITLITAFGGLLSSLVVLLTLFEMKKQRQSTYKPDVIVESSEVFISWNKTFSMIIANIWTRKELDIDDDNILSLKQLEPIAFNIQNVGYGVAKKVEIQWSYDVHKLVDYIKEIDKNNVFEFEKSNYNHKKHLSIKTEDGMSTNDISFNFNKFRDYIMPISIETNYIENLKLPLDYTKLYSIYLFLIYDKIDDHFDENGLVFNLPLKLRIRYYDLGGKRYTKNFVTKLDLHRSYGSQKLEFETAFQGSIKFVETR